MKRALIGIICFLLSLPVTHYGSADDASDTIVLGPDKAIYFVDTSQAAEPASPSSTEASDFIQNATQAQGAVALPLATVDYHDETAQVHRAYVTGSALASISRDKILSSDSDEVHQEVRSALQNMQAFIGDFTPYDFFVGHIGLDDTASESPSPYTIRIEQRIDGFEAGSGRILVGADDEVKMVTFTFINPEQEGTDAAKRLPDTQIRQLAQAALRAELGEDAIDKAPLQERSRVFEPVDEQVRCH